MTAIIKFHFTGVVVRAALNNCGRWSCGGLKALGRALRKGIEGKQPIVNRHKFSMETLELLIRTGQFLEFKKKNNINHQNNTPKVLKYRIPKCHLCACFY